MSELKENELDRGVALTKGIAGAIPFAGPIISEIISTIIPNQRIDRIAKFLEFLDQKISRIEQETLKKDKYFVDLFEDCLIQATRALSEKRNRYIAIFLSKSKNLDEATYSAKKKLLHILEELTDQDIDLLKSIKNPLQRDNSFYGGLSYGSYQRLSD